MPQVRAMRLISAIEAGRTPATQLQSLIDGDAGRLGELRALLKLRGQCDRIKVNPAVVAVLFGTPATLAALQAVDTAQTRIYTPAFGEASTMAAVAASPQAMASLADNASAVSALVASSVAMTQASASSVAVAALSDHLNANNQVLAGSFKVGAYLDKIAVDAGAASSATLAALNTLGSVNASSSAMASVAASAPAMNAIARSANARAVIGSSGNGYDAIKVSPMAIGKLVAGFAGLDPTDFAHMDAVAASAVARAAIGTSGAAYDAIKLSDLAMAKYIAGSAGLAPASVASLSALMASASAMQVVADSTPALAALVGSSLAIAAAVASTPAMAALVATVKGRMALYQSDALLAALAGSATAMAAARAATAYTVLAWAEKGQTPEPLSLPGTAYVVLGASRSVVNTRTVTLETLRAGSTQSATTPTIGTIANTSATEVNTAIPIAATFTARLSGTGSGTGYLGLLRCDA